MRHSILIWIITLLFLLASASGISVNSCGTINQDSELNATVNATATCFTMGTNNVTLDCQGLKINYNSDGESNAGVIATDRDNVTIKNCLINDNAGTASTGGRGITFTRTNNSVINNTDIIAQGNNGRGLLLTDVHFNIIDTVNITINDSRPVIGINILSSSSGNNISNVNISLINSTAGINLTGITQSSSSGNVFTNIFIRSTLSVVRWITSNPSANTFMNLSLLRATGDIKFINVNISEGFNISHVEITQNNAFVNSSNKTFLNSSARITLSNVSQSSQPLVDFEDDETFVDCPGSVCTTVSSSGSSVVFDVTQFTSYSSQVEVNNCSDINVTTILTGPASAPNTCFDITGNNLTLDCQGFTVFYDTDGEGGTGIRALGQDNVTIKNCNISDAAAAGNGGRGIDFDGTNNSVIANSTVTSRGNAGGNDGISIVRGVNITVENTNITVIDTGSASGGGFGIQLNNVTNSIFRSNNVTTLGNTNMISFGLSLLDASNLSFIDLILRNASEWINSTVSSDNFYINLTFATNNGSIKFTGNNSINATEITQQKLNITSANRVFLNSTDLTFLNTSADISISNVTTSDPNPTIDFEDDGTFEACPSSICTEVSFDGGVFVFSVTQFTSFSSAEGNVNITLTKSDGADPLDSSRELNYTITITNNGGDASNVSLTETYPAEIIFISSEPTAVSGNNTFVIGNISEGSSFALNITVFVNNVSVQTVINNTVNITFQNASGSVLDLSVSETTTVNAEPAPVAGAGGGSSSGGGGVRRRTTPVNTTPEACFESWACAGWTECASGLQTRECEDLRACGTTALKPYTSQTCNGESVPIIEPEEPAAEEPVADTSELPVIEEPSGFDMNKIFYGLAILALIILGGYWYSQRGKGKK